MQRFQRIFISAGILALMLTATGAQFNGPEGGFDLSWRTIDGGGAMFSIGGGFQLGGTIGQFDAGAMSGGGFQLTGGFWPVAAQPAQFCLGDIEPLPSGDGFVNVNDLLAVIVAWGACADPGNCPADIAPLGGDGQVNVIDLLTVINAWGPCP